ncbi:MAG: PDZ domain-containing protein [Candidatus Rokubacteria bacterium]|nr:PDZ domain-containing protein [Candidatus Rokubacteria bacterium]
MTIRLRRGSRLASRLVLMAAVLVLAAGLCAGPARAQEVITNESVVAMTRAGLPESVIVAKLRSGHSALDLRADALIALKQAGVSDRILEAMVATGSAAPDAGSSAPAPAGPSSHLGDPPAGPRLPGPMSQLPGSEALLPPSGAGEAPPMAPPPAWAAGSAAPQAADAQDGLGALLGALKSIADLVASTGSKAERRQDAGGEVGPPPEPILGSPAPPALPEVPPAPAAEGPSPMPPEPVPATPPVSPSAGSAPDPRQFAPRTGRLGVRVETLTAEAARSLGTGASEGAVLREVFPDSAAAVAGLRPGDVVTRINGQSVRSSEEMLAALAHRMRGERSRLAVVRGSAAGEIVVPAASEFSSPDQGAPLAARPERPPVATPRPAAPPAGLAAAAGTYRCWMFNVGGAGGRCRTSPPIILRADGTYEESSTRGSWTLRGSQVLLAGSTVRGAGRLESGNQIVFEYVYNGQPHRVTYLRQDGTGADAPAGAPARTVAAPPATPAPPAAAPSRVPVELTIRFAASDGSVGWINSVALIPAGGTTGPEALGRTDGKRSVAASFRSVEAGHVYTVHVSSGLHRWPVGTIDLRAPAGPVALTVNAPAPAARRDSGAPAPRDAVAPARAEPAGAAAGKPCDPRLPRYAQKGCTE